MRGALRRSLLSLIAVPLVTLVAACGSDQAPSQHTGPVAVEAITVEPRPFDLRLELPGRIEPVRIAEVRARVSGNVLSRTFQEGQDVKAGQVLFQIDPAPLKAALLRSQGELARAHAALSNAHAVVRRYQPLADIEAISKQDLDAARAAYESAQAARQSAAADVEVAKLNLGYATVRAPISGRIGRTLVNEGALVGQNEATPMATIQQLAPIYADFKQPVGEMLQVREALNSGKLVHAGKQVPVSVTVDGFDKQREGRLLFTDAVVDRTTGEVALRAQFDNADRFLLPGMYVRVNVSQGVDPAAILMPQRAVSRGTDGTASVLVIGKDNVVEPRPVVTGAMQGNLWHIRQGLRAGERVVIGGSAVPGTKVVVATPKTQKQKG